jgi:hypothetical protein
MWQVKTCGVIVVCGLLRCLSEQREYERHHRSSHARAGRVV